MENIKAQIEATIQKELPKFWHEVTINKGYFGEVYIAIKIAANTKLINSVASQRPQAISLKLNPHTFELSVQIYGGCGGRTVYRQPRKTDDKERYLAMKGIKLPFRTPKKELPAVLQAIKTFCMNYKKVLAENYSELCYHDLVNYDEILN